MIRLHERLSEFSYGYGVIREVEKLLKEIGIASVPFLPSLVHEKEVAFDVAFDKPGAVIMLQFKLGEELRRFHRAHAKQPIPVLTRPFWRFHVDLNGHQFQRLHQAQAAGADAYYVAPRFSSWPEYEDAFHDGAVLERSLLVAPSAISAGAQPPSGKHRIVYDHEHRYVCSDPVAISETTRKEFSEYIEANILVDKAPLAALIRQLANELDRFQALPRLSEERRAKIIENARSREDADAAIVGLEAWIQGAQIVFAGTGTN